MAAHPEELAMREQGGEERTLDGMVGSAASLEISKWRLWAQVETKQPEIVIIDALGWRTEICLHFSE
jgi:hypothetical protein